MDQEYQQVDNQYEILGVTNNVLVAETNNQIQLFLPAYLRSKLKNIVALDVSTGIGLMNSVLILSIYYDKIDETFPGILEYLEKNIVLRFKIDPPIKLAEGFQTYTDKQGEQRSSYITKKVDQKQKLITFSIRKMFAVNLVSHVFWSPFQYIEFVSTIALDTIVVKGLEHNVKINFNLMDFNKEDKFSVVSYTDEAALGEFDLASAKIAAEFSNQRFYSKDLQNQLDKKKDKLQQQIEHQKQLQQKPKEFTKKIESFEYGHIIYPVYRRPLVPMFNIFFPVIILGLINLGIFFQESDALAKRITNIAALLVSYLYFLPIVREKIPPSNSLTITEIILFSMASLTVLTYVHSISIRDIQDYEFVWTEEIMFQIVLFGTVMIISVLFTFGLIMAFVLVPSYKLRQMGKEEKFKKENWSNLGCDEYFQKLEDAGLKIMELANFSSSSLGKKKEKKKKWYE